MAKCELCGKGPNFGHNVSHANNRTKKMWKPNVQRVKASEKVAADVGRVALRRGPQHATLSR